MFYRISKKKQEEKSHDMQLHQTTVNTIVTSREIIWLAKIHTKPQ